MTNVRARSGNSPHKTCIVDGDTLWLNGENIRLKDFDTPEPQTQICGGEREVALAHKASARLLQILNMSIRFELRPPFASNRGSAAYVERPE
jgi:endonuclease YncB( thermonuclease family)